MLADLHAHPAESQAPGKGADERVGDELPHWHARHAGGKGDEGADNGQEARDEHGDLAAPLEKALRPGQVLGVHEDVLAVLLDQRPPSVLPRVVGGNGPDHAADGAGEGDPEEREASRADQVAGERHDHLARERDAGALDPHEEHDAAVAHGGDDSGDPGEERFEDPGDHELLLATRRLLLGAGARGGGP